MGDLRLIPTDQAIQKSTDSNEHYVAILQALGLSEGDVQREYTRLQSRPSEWLAERGWVRK